MKSLEQVLRCVLLVVLVALAAGAIVVERAATATVEAAGQEVRGTRAALVEELRDARLDLKGELTAARRDVLARSEREVAALRSDLVGEAEAVRTTADARMGDALARADRALSVAEALDGQLQPVLAHSAGITAQVENGLPLFLDCDHNADCVFNRYQGTAKAMERAAGDFSAMSVDFRRDWPGYLHTWDGIGRNVEETTASIDKLTKPHWYDRVIGYGLNAAVIYRNLNPVTSLAVTGAQIVSGRP
jgi:hypothetical protein